MHLIFVLDIYGEKKQCYFLLSLDYASLPTMIPSDC